MDLKAKKAIVRKIRRGLRVTEVTCTRSVKSYNGSVLVGMTAITDEATLEESSLAALILGAEVDQTAYDRAMAGSVISSKEHGTASQVTRNNYSLLLDELLGKSAQKSRDE